MSRGLAILGGVLVLALMAAGLTEVTLAAGGRGSLANDRLLRPASSGAAASSPTPAVKPSPTTRPVITTSPSPSASPSSTSAAPPQATPSGPTATTNAFVHLRSGASTATDIVENLDGGTVVQILPYSDAQWQQVEYQGVSGYVFKSYLNY